MPPLPTSSPHFSLSLDESTIVIGPGFVNVENGGFVKKRCEVTPGPEPELHLKCVNELLDSFLNLVYSTCLFFLLLSCSIMN